MKHIDFKTLNNILIHDTGKSVWKIEPMAKDMYKVIYTDWEEAVVISQPEKGIIYHDWL